ncbi:hypothetical protein DBR06_SOUSAS6510012, partial [Sousa chinensis]
STVPLSGGHSPDELEINSTDPFPDSIVNLGLIEDEKKKSRQRRPKPLYQEAAPTGHRGTNTDVGAQPRVGGTRSATTDAPPLGRKAQQTGVTPEPTRAWGAAGPRAISAQRGSASPSPAASTAQRAQPNLARSSDPAAPVRTPPTSWIRYHPSPHGTIRTQPARLNPPSEPGPLVGPVPPIRTPPTGRTWYRPSEPGTVRTRPPARLTRYRPLEPDTVRTWLTSRTRYRPSEPSPARRAARRAGGRSIT